MLFDHAISLIRQKYLFNKFEKQMHLSDLVFDSRHMFDFWTGHSG